MRRPRLPAAPAPASPGTALRRRTLLRRGAAAVAAGAAARAGALSGFLHAGTARAGGGRRILVLLRLHGGNDGLNTVVPHRASEYLDGRPTLRVTDGLHVLGDHDTLALHPRLERLAGHYSAGRLAIVQGVGYAPASLSHFRSEVIWQSADPVGVTPTGWVGRYLDTLSPPGDPEVRGFDVAAGLDHVFLSERANTFAFAGLGGIEFPSDTAAWWDVTRKREAFDVLSAVPRTGDAADALARGGLVLSRNLDVYAALPDPVATPFPDTALGRGLREAARIVAAARTPGSGVEVGVLQVGIGGFDTHSGQDAVGGHPDLWTAIDAALHAFHTELSAQGAAGDVVVLAYSEFGRRVEENGSAGTDHGEAAPVFVFGDAVAGGVHGDDPDLAFALAQNDGNVRHDIDFRRVYATLLADWLGADPDPILGGSFATIPFLRE